MEKGFIIRELKFEDFNDLVNTYFAYYEEIKGNPDLGITLFKKKPGMSDEVNWFTSLYKGKLEGNRVVLVAEVNGKTVGICEISRFMPGTIADHSAILGIAIGKAYRSQGIGSALVKQAIKKSRGKFEQLTLSVFESNKTATNLYKKFGFKEYGMLPNAIKRGNNYRNVKFMYLNLK